jgi:hypothetical protein
VATISERGDDKLMKKKEEKRASYLPPSSFCWVITVVAVVPTAPCPTHPRILPIVVVLCDLSSSSLTVKSPCVIVVRSTRGPPCEQLLAAVGVGAGPSVIDVGVVVVVLVVPSPSSGPCHRRHHGLVQILVVPSSSSLTPSSSATRQCHCPCLIGLLSFAPCRPRFRVLDQQHVAWLLCYFRIIAFLGTPGSTCFLGHASDSPAI